MKRRAFLAALGLAPFFKWLRRKPNPEGWFIAEFKHYPAPPGAWGCAKDVILWRREKETVDKS